jgi:hypothetical protein
MGGVGDGKSKGFGVLVDLCKPLPMFAAPFVIIETALQNADHLILLVDPWKLLSQTRMTPQFSCQQSPIPSVSCGQCACRTDFHTLTAPYTSVIIDYRRFFRVLQADRIFGTHFYT